MQNLIVGQRVQLIPEMCNEGSHWDGVGHCNLMVEQFLSAQEQGKEITVMENKWDYKNMYLLRCDGASFWFPEVAVESYSKLPKMFKFRHKTTNNEYNAEIVGDTCYVTWGTHSIEYAAHTAEKDVKKGIWIIQKPEPVQVAPKTIPRVHAELIKIWADDKDAMVEFYSRDAGAWYNTNGLTLWNASFSFKIGSNYSLCKSDVAKDLSFAFNKMKSVLQSHRTEEEILMGYLKANNLI